MKRVLALAVLLAAATLGLMMTGLSENDPGGRSPTHVA